MPEPCFNPCFFTSKSKAVLGFQLLKAAHVMCVEVSEAPNMLPSGVPGMYCSQSASERVNGLIKFVTGDPLRNNMSYDTRCSLASVASKYKAMQGASRKEHMPSDVSAF